MVLEALVTSLCIGQYKCDTALKAYYEQTPSFKHKVKEYKKDVEELTGKTAMYVAPAIVALGTGKLAHVRLTKTLTLEASHDSMVFMYGFTF